MAVEVLLKNQEMVSQRYFRWVCNVMPAYNAN